MAFIDVYTKEELTNIVQQSSNYNEVLKKLGYPPGRGKYDQILKDRINKYNIDTSHFFISSKNHIKRNENNVFIKNSSASQATLRRWYLKGEYTEYKCSICGQEPFWNNKELTLILDHINGINNDDRLENLRWVCPNCNQQLDTTGFKKIRVQNPQLKKKYYCSNCGKEITAGSKSGLCAECANKKQRICERPSRDELKKLIRTMPFTQIAKIYHVTDNAIRKWCDAENLPKKVSEIKKITDKDWELI